MGFKQTIIMFFLFGLRHTGEGSMKRWIPSFSVCYCFLFVGTVLPCSVFGFRLVPPFCHCVLLAYGIAYSFVVCISIIFSTATALINNTLLHWSVKQHSEVVQYCIIILVWRQLVMCVSSHYSNMLLSGSEQPATESEVSCRPIK